MIRITVAMSDDWMDFAACKGEDASVFFCDESDPEQVAEAKSICDDCPVIEPCLESSLGMEHGIWAGMTSRERKFVRLGK